MMYIGMDVSSKEFVVYGLDERKQKIFDKTVEASRDGLRRIVKQLGEGPKLIVFEAGNQMKWIALTLKKIKDVHVHVVHPNEVKWITQSNGKKTDKVDARKLAELARGDMLPRQVHIVEGSVRELRELASGRDQLQRKRVALINTVRGLMLQEGYRLPEKFFQRLDWREQLEKKKLCEVQQAIIESFMASIEALKESEDKLKARMIKIEDKRIEKLESIPCIGKISSRVILGAIDDAQRFDNKKCVANYGALTPTIYQSGEVVNHGKINRDGRHEVRRVLLQCSHSLSRMKSSGAKPLKEFYERIEKRRGKKKAIVALARKLLTVAYGVLKNDEYYDPRKLTAYAV
jgi:transposase